MECSATARIERYQLHNTREQSRCVRKMKKKKKNKARARAKPIGKESRVSVNKAAREMHHPRNAMQILSFYDAPFFPFPYTRISERSAARCVSLYFSIFFFSFLFPSLSLLIPFSQSTTYACARCTFFIVSKERAKDTPRQT